MNEVDKFYFYIRDQFIVMDILLTTCRTTLITVLVDFFS